MSDRFEVHQFAGYTDGKPSWRKVQVPYSSTYLRVSVEAEVKRLEKASPNAKFRVRKARKR